MNLTSIVGRTSGGMKMLCLAGLLSFPVMSLQAASVTMTETGGTMLLKADDSTVKQVFDYIERHSKYVFVYDQKVKNLLSIIRKTKCSRSAKRNDIFAKRNVYVFSSL